MKYTISFNAMVENANAFHGYVAGFSPPLTIYGFSEFLKLEIIKNMKLNPEIYCDFLKSTEEFESNNNASFDYAKIGSFIYGFCGNTFKLNRGHEAFVTYMKEHDKYARVPKDSESKNLAANAPIVDLKSYSSDFFVSFDINFNLSLPESSVFMEYLKKLLFKILNGNKFAGGTITNLKLNNIYIFENSIITNIEAINKNLKFKNNSWFIIEKPDVSIKNGTESFENLINLIKRPKYKENITESKENSEFNYKKYYVPTILGYRFLESIKDPEEGSRYPYKNVLAEPMLSFVRCRSLSSFIKHEDYQDAIWVVKKNEKMIYVN